MCILRGCLCYRWTGLSPRLTVTQLHMFNCRHEHNMNEHVLLKIVGNPYQISKLPIHHISNYLLR